MALFVYKFGGTSLGAIGASPREIAARVQNCALHVERAVKNGDQIAVVVSAVGGETDRLVDLWRAVGGGGDGDGAREYDLVVSTGETVSAGLFAAALRARQIPARAMTGAAAGIKTDSSHGKARLSNIDPKPVRAALAAGVVPVITGFQGATATGEVATLGRGGSDTSAVALAAAVKAAECLIFTDVEGVATTDPRVCENARRLDRVTFEEMIEMASLGSKVLQIRAVALAGKTKTRCASCRRSTPIQNRRGKNRAAPSSPTSPLWNNPSSPESPSTAAKRKSPSPTRPTARASPAAFSARLRRKISISI